MPIDRPLKSLVVAVGLLWGAIPVAAAIPGNITDLNASPGLQVDLSWTCPGRDGATGDCTGGQWQIKYSSTPGSTDSTAEYALFISTDWVQGARFSTGITGLAPDSTYYFWIWAVNDTGLWSAAPSSATCVVGAFSDIRAGLTGIQYSSLSWGDYDNDGQLDLALAGFTGSTGISRIYRSAAGVLTNTGAAIQGVYGCSLSWGDYDNDGDLDLALTGFANSSRIATVYRNDAGVFADTGAALTGTIYGSLGWGDHDNDGYLDIALAGHTAGGTGISAIYRNAGGVFTEVSTLTGVYHSSLAWGDYDNDGDLDLALAGTIDDSTDISTVYRNDAGVFTDAGAALPGLVYSSLAWGDHDSDGLLDLALAGNYFSAIYRNAAGTFTDSGAVLRGVTACSLAWGDFDNNGELDLALSGLTIAAVSVSDLYRNTGGSFTDAGSSMRGASNASLAWGDYDNDGDLDLALSGSLRADIYRSFYADTLDANAPPAAPGSGFALSFLNLDLMLSWGKGSDVLTPQDGLYYDVRVATSPITDMLASWIVSPSTSAAGVGSCGQQTLGNYSHGYRAVGPQPGLVIAKRNAFTRGTTVYWQVRSIDAGLAKSPWSAIQQSVLSSFVTADISNNATTEIATDLDVNPVNGYEHYSSVDTTATVRMDGDGDGKYDFFISTAGSAAAEIYWDPDHTVISTITLMELTGDATPDWVFDSGGDGLPDHYYDPVGAAVSPVPFAVADINGDGLPDYAFNTDANAANGFEDYQSIGTTVATRVDADGDGKYDYFISTAGAAGVPEEYWDPDHAVIYAIIHSDVNGDGTTDWVFDSNGNGLPDRYYDPIAGTASPVPFAVADVNGDGIVDYGYNTDGSAANGFEDYQSINTTVTLRTDTDGDGKFDYFISTAGSSVLPEKFWDPDHSILSTVIASDIDHDGTPDWVFDSGGDGLMDAYYDPAAGAVRVYARTMTADIGNDGAPDTAFDADNDPSNGYERYSGVGTTATVRMDGDGDGKYDFFISTADSAAAEIYWDPDHAVISTITLMDLNSDGTSDWVYDSNGDGLPDKYYDPVGAAVNPVPFAVADVNGDGLPDYAFNADANAANGFEDYRSVNTTVTLRADTDGDGRYDYFISTAAAAGIPERFWDPDSGVVSTIFLVDITGDGTADWLYDADGDGTDDSSYDPATGALATGPAVEVTGLAGPVFIDLDGNPANGYETCVDPAGRAVAVVRLDGDNDGRNDFLVDINGDGIPDSYADPDNNRVTPVRVSDYDGDGIPDWGIDSDGDGICDRYWRRLSGLLLTIVRITDEQAYVPVPNPFYPDRGALTIVYDLAHDGPVIIDVYDIAGELLAVLVNGDRRAGRHQIRWTGANGEYDAADGQTAGFGGTVITKGVYIMRFKLGGRQFMKKIGVIR